MNPNTNHTPGPWRVANGRIYSRAYQTALDLRLFVICDLDMGNDPRGEQESNARLIAAAPELLATLERLLSIANDGAVMRHETGKPAWSFIDEVKTQARAAITKATAPNA